MGRNCFEGYLTDACSQCEYWRDGSGDSIGCAYPGSIDNCDAFTEEYEKHSAEA